MDRRWLGSWLSGPGSVRDAEPGQANGAGPAAPGHPGERLGLPRDGSGSVPGLGRRIVALFLDWAVANAIGFGLLHTGGWAVLGIFALENVLLVGTIGSTIGHRLLGIRVVRVDGRLPGPLWALVRTLLLCVFIPALLMDRDHRGLHDRAANTVPVRI